MTYDLTGGHCLTIVVPMLWPNEASIFGATAQHWEATLARLPHVRCLFVLNPSGEPPSAVPKHPGIEICLSHTDASKAEKLNLGARVASTDFVAFYDADSRPSADSLSLGLSHIQLAGMDFIQGAKLVHPDNRSTLVGSLVDCETRLNYLDAMPRRQRIFGLTYFTGSNGFWRREALLRDTFDRRAFIEDVDISLRVLLDGGCSSYCEAAVAVEEAPPDLISLIRQRRRWLYGWLQLSRRFPGEVARSASVLRPHDATRRILFWITVLYGRTLVTTASYGAIFWAVVNWVGSLPVAVLVATTTWWSSACGTYAARLYRIERRHPMLDTRVSRADLRGLALLPIFNILCFVILLSTFVVPPKVWCVTARRSPAGSPG